MFKFNNTHTVLNEFGEDVVKRVKKNLNTTGFRDKGRKISPRGSDLYESIEQEITVTERGFEQEFGSSEDYAGYAEEGRKRGKFVPIKPLMRYIKKRKMRLRKTFVNSNGQKVSQFVPTNEKNIKSAAFAMSTNIKRKGIEPGNFFSEALDYEFEKLPPELQEAYAEDVADFSFQDFQKKGYNVTKI